MNAAPTASPDIGIVLKSPRIPENIGSVARAMCNMGLNRLLVVTPREFDLERIRRTATHIADDVVKNIEIYDKLTEALASFRFIVGTTARRGRTRKAVFSPAEIARKLTDLSRSNSSAVLFGPEDRGLTNEDLSLCHELVHIPTAAFASLNLSQAVMIICYELFSTAHVSPSPPVPRLAKRIELDRMYEQLSEILVRIGYLNPQNSDYWIGHLRRFLSRIGLRAGEVTIIRGICRQINWYGRKCHADGGGGEPFDGPPDPPPPPEFSADPST